jgi:hypothetical protein
MKKSPCFGSTHIQIHVSSHYNISQDDSLGDESPKRKVTDATILMAKLYMLRFLLILQSISYPGRMFTNDDTGILVERMKQRMHRLQTSFIFCSNFRGETSYSHVHHADYRTRGLSFLGGTYLRESLTVEWSSSHLQCSWLGIDVFI